MHPATYSCFSFYNHALFSSFCFWPPEDNPAINSAYYIQFSGFCFQHGTDKKQKKQIRTQVPLKKTIFAFKTNSIRDKLIGIFVFSQHKSCFKKIFSRV